MFIILIVNQTKTQDCEEEIAWLNRNNAGKPEMPVYECALNPVIGKGGFGTVFRVRDSTTLKNYALKFQQAPLSDFSLIEGFEKEIRYTMSFNHPNVISGKQMIKMSDSVTKTYLLLMELIEGVSLTKWLVQNPSPQKEKISIIMFYLLIGIKYLKDKKVVHLDIKDDNVMITNKTLINPFTGNQELMEVPVIIDFGLAEDIGSKMNGLGGTVPFQDIDLIKQYFNGYSQNSEFSNKNDIYALGETFYLMLEKHLRCNVNNSWKDRLKLCKANEVAFDRLQNSGFKMLIANMLKPDPASRLTIEELLWYFMEFIKPQNAFNEPESSMIDCSVYKLDGSYMKDYYQQYARINIPLFNSQQFEDKIKVYFTQKEERDGFIEQPQKPTIGAKIPQAPQLAKNLPKQGQIYPPQNPPMRQGPAYVQNSPANNQPLLFQDLYKPRGIGLAQQGLGPGYVQNVPAYNQQINAQALYQPGGIALVQQGLGPGYVQNVPAYNQQINAQALYQPGGIALMQQNRAPNYQYNQRSLLGKAKNIANADQSLSHQESNVNRVLLTEDEKSKEEVNNSELSSNDQQSEEKSENHNNQIISLMIFGLVVLFIGVGLLIHFCRLRKNSKDLVITPFETINV